MDELDGFSLKVRQYPKKKLPYQILKLKPDGYLGEYQGSHTTGVSSGEGEPSDPGIEKA